ncbi:MAG: hypothetical protein EB075_08765, partial [Bacteroidetes bacterium]|nr:hypothetical protein [Bacteroidota bacterium]
ALPIAAQSTRPSTEQLRLRDVDHTIRVQTGIPYGLTDLGWTTVEVSFDPMQLSALVAPSIAGDQFATRLSARHGSLYVAAYAGVYRPEGRWRPAGALLHVRQWKTSVYEITWALGFSYATALRSAWRVSLATEQAHTGTFCHQFVAVRRRCELWVELRLASSGIRVEYVPERETMALGFDTSVGASMRVNAAVSVHRMLGRSWTCGIAWKR